jgi:uncharacterized protein
MLRERLSEALKTAMKSRDQRATATVRMILAGLKDRDIEARTRGNSAGIGEAEMAEMLQKMIRQRQESIALYQQGGRQDLVDQESAEIRIIEQFLPQQLSEAELAAAVEQAVADTGAAGVKDMGRVMAWLKERYAGQMPMAKVGPMVKQRLG